MAQKIDLTGKQFGSLTVIKCAGCDKWGASVWECLCECGNKTIVRGYHLRKEKIKSCGCLQKSLLSKRMKENHTGGNFKHNGTKTRLYQIWANIKTRCFNSKNRAFKWYGAVGVTMCAEWLDFANFRDWALQSGYKEDLTIERINPFGNYEPSNCTWVTKSEQRKNQRRSKQWQK